jgi:hypothetical protein
VSRQIISMKFWWRTEAAALRLAPAQADARLARKQENPAPSRKELKPHYDPRIDFFRGLSLIFIFINHIPDNAFSYLTSRAYSLFDSAEVFMFLAGYSLALSYYNLVPQGIQAFGRKALRRARAILTYHLLLLVFVLTAAYAITEAAGIKTGYEVFLEKVQDDPWGVLLASPLLAFQAPLLDILPMYIVVILLAPYLVWLRVRSEVALLVASGLLWMFASRFLPSIPTIIYDVSWNFNPLCWQFLLAIGLAFGWRTRSGAAPVATGEARRVIDACCASFVVFSAIVLMAIAFNTIDATAANRLRSMYFSLNKQCLDIWRLAGLLASAYLISGRLSKDAAWLKVSVSRWVCAAGAASLPIFSLTVVLSFAGKFLVPQLGGGIQADAIVTGTGVVIILAVAMALSKGWPDAVLGRLWALLRIRATPVQQPS